MRIFVEGLGRCGSSLVYLALAAAAPPDFRKDFIQRISNAPTEAGIYKTHDYRPQTFVEGDRVVYLFGEPERIVQSVFFTEREFKEEHFRNFGREYLSDEESLLLHDGLGLCEHFRSWKDNSSGIPTLFLHYDAIWANLKLLRDFTRLDLVLPERVAPRVLPAINLKADFSDLRREMTERVFIRPAALETHMTGSTASGHSRYHDFDPVGIGRSMRFQL